MLFDPPELLMNTDTQPSCSMPYTPKRVHNSQLRIWEHPQAQTDDGWDSTWPHLVPLHTSGGPRAQALSQEGRGISELGGESHVGTISPSKSTLTPAEGSPH